MKVNLRTLASEVATEEGRKKSAGGVAQVTEVLGVLGRRWRGMYLWQAMAEFMAIRSRAGKRNIGD